MSHANSTPHQTPFAHFATLFRWASALLLIFCGTAIQAQDTTALARELLTLKGGYAEKKQRLEEVRIRAYVPILLKAVGKGPSWKPGHPNWLATERRITEEWRKHYLDLLSRTGRLGSTARDTNFGWVDDAFEREYARVFNAEELGALLAFYRTAAGSALLSQEKEFLDFYPNEMLRSLARVMLGTEPLTAREREQFHAPEGRARREFVELFEVELVVHAECLRIGNPYLDASQPLVQQGALATAADAIDALRRKLDAATVADVQAFLKSDLGRKERVFVGAALPTVTPVDEDPVRSKAEEAAFYQGLQQLSAQWRELAAKPPAQP